MRQIRPPQALQTAPSAFQFLPEAIQRTSPRTRVIAGVALLVVAVVALRIASGFWGNGPHAAPPAPVRVATATRGNLPVFEQAIGTVLANASVQVASQIDGQVLAVDFKEGQLVHKGDLLFQIDPKPYQAALDSAVADLTTTKDKAERYARLLAEKAVAPQDADDARAAYLQAAAAVAIAKLNLTYTQIRSPIDGKTGPILIYPGNQVRASASGTAGTATAQASTTESAPAALVVINQIQPVKLSFALPQTELPLIQQRMHAGPLMATVKVHNADANTQAILVPVDFVSNAVDASTGTIELRATYANADSRLVPGELVDVSLALSQIDNAVIVPHEAVNLGQDNHYVFVVTKDNKAVMRPVTVLHDDGSRAAIQGNVQPGDIVVTEGQLRLIPGAPVAIVRPGTAAADGAAS